MRILPLLLLLLLALVPGCGDRVSSSSVLSPATEPTAPVEIRHTLFKGVIHQVTHLRATALRDQEVVFGPHLEEKQALVRLAIPVRANRLRLEYLNGESRVGLAEVALDLKPGIAFLVTDPEILLDVATTTLDRSIVTTGDGPYKRLTYGPGWSRVVRSDLAEPQAGREDRRQALLCMPHFSDVHIMDEESPLRIEFMRNLTGAYLPASEFQAAWRPQEALSTQVAESMVRQINDLAFGPALGRPFDCAVFTGDNGDNRHESELRRFLTLMDGGAMQPSTGDPDRYEGVQDQQQPFLTQYWHPDPGPSDDYKTLYGFPEYAGLLQAACQRFAATGLKTPWYTCYGNHDHLIQGNFPARPEVAPVDALSHIATSDTKILDLPLVFKVLGEKVGVDTFLAEFLDPLGLALTTEWPDFIGHWTSVTTSSRKVTSDPSRRILTRADFVQAHLDSGSSPGPVGHGFTPANLGGKLYYTFEPAPGILGITLDTTNPGGLNNGSVDREQADWMEHQIQQVSSHYYDANGTLIQTGNADKLVILFSHHSIETMTNVLPDPANPSVVRLLGPTFEALLHRYPNVVLWMNGHTHYSRVYAHKDVSNRTGGFWEVNTPGLIDFPEQARIVELADNQDGTLSIFATLVDTAAPPETGTPGDPLSLASISRELSANDPQILQQKGGLDFQIGKPSDRNVELLILKP